MVYVVWFSNFHGEDELVGIFGMEANAARYIENHSDGQQMRVEPYELDDNPS